MSSIGTQLGLERSPGPTWRSRFGGRYAGGGGPLRWFGLAAVIVAGGLGAAVLTGMVRAPSPPLAETLSHRTNALYRTRGQMALQEIQLQRLREIQRYSAEYDIPSDLATSIYDIALAEALPLDIAFRMVDVESSFRQRAVSTAGAVGLTQIKPSTAKWLDPSVTYEQLFDRDTNLRLGFRYLKVLLGRYDEDTRLALLAYNRGPTKVGSLLAMGTDPSNGYARQIMRGSGRK